MRKSCQYRKKHDRISRLAGSVLLFFSGGYKEECVLLGHTVRVYSIGSGFSFIRALYRYYKDLG
jgi:hypothetical protein